MSTAAAGRVLVTGGSGFIGSACLPRLLSRRYEVHAVSSGTHAQATDVHWHRADLLHAEQVTELLAATQPTHLLHLAWIATPGEFWSSPANLQWLSASIGLLDAFYRQGGKRVLGVGTCAEYAWGTADYIEHSTPLDPQTIYGRCKRALHLALLAAAEVHGGSAAWARLFFPYGPGEPPQRIIPAVIRALLRGERIDCTEGTQVRDFVFVEDVADALVSLLDSQASGAYNVGSGQAISLRDVVAIVTDRLGRSQLVCFGARTPPSGDPPRVVADIGKLRRDTGWQPAVSLEAGIERTIEYWRTELAIPRT